MSASITAEPVVTGPVPSRATTQRVPVLRAVVALLWAAAVVIAVGDAAKTTSSDVPVAAAALLALYPLIDVVASVVGANAAAPSTARVLRFGAAISALAVVAIAGAGFGSDAGAVLVAFGAWAAISGALQFAVALRTRRTHGGQIALLISGAVSTIAGLSFIAGSQGDAAKLGTLGGYMAAGAVLFLISAYVGRTQSPAR
jgi:uncharacterized membrane protein HdeD (DUF308 family)